MRGTPRASARQTFGIVATGVVALVAFAVVTQARDGVTANPTDIVITHPSYPQDFSDERILVGFSEYVFLGEVVERVGDKGVPTSAPDIEIPQTQFLVKVITPIKGKLPSEVVVSQSSGVDKSTGVLILIDGDPLLRAGETVMFAVNEEPDFGWYTIVAGPFGATRAEDAQEAAVLVDEFRAAEGEQFVPVPAADPTDEEKSRRAE